MTKEQLKNEIELYLPENITVEELNWSDIILCGHLEELYRKYLTL